MAVELIAEFCQNHNGDFGIVERMLDAAAENGATTVKLQTIFVDRLAFRPQFEEGLVRDGQTLSIKRPFQPEYDRLKKLEISMAEQAQFVELCRARRAPMTTCFSRDTAEAIHAAGFRDVKVASYDCASYPLLRDVLGLFERVVVSTGATFDDEIRHAAGILRGHNFAFLHCVTKYPTALSDANLARLEWLRTLAPRVGYSDHSLVKRDGIVASLAAIHMGAEIVERHFTVLERDQTRDGPVSIGPEQLRELAGFAALSRDEQRSHLDELHPEWKACIGSKERALSDEELLNRDYYRGRFASRRPGWTGGRAMIYNFEETPLP